MDSKHTHIIHSAQNSVIQWWNLQIQQFSVHQSQMHIQGNDTVKDSHLLVCLLLFFVVVFFFVISAHSLSFECTRFPWWCITHMSTLFNMWLQGKTVNWENHFFLVFEEKMTRKYVSLVTSKRSEFEKLCSQA